MSVRNALHSQYTVLARSSRLRQVVAELNADRVEFYVVVQHGGQYMATTRRFLKERIAALADEFGDAALDLELGDLPGFWRPQKPLAADTDAAEARSTMQEVEALPVAESGQLIGVFRQARRGVGNAMLSTLYGPRFAVFSEQKPGAPAPARACPNCARPIEFYKPKRVADKIERHCPHCDAGIAADPQ